jgi:hypothetical protein
MATIKVTCRELRCNHEKTEAERAATRLTISIGWTIFINKRTPEVILPRSTQRRKI